MPSWKKVITSGSSAELNSLKLTGTVNAGTDTDKFLVLDAAGNIDYRTGAQVLTDIGGQGAGYIIAPNQTYVDCKGITEGAIPFGNVTDLQDIDRSFGVYIASANGYLESVIISPENGNTTTDDINLDYYVNGSQVGSTVTVAMGSAGTNKTFTFGSSNYSFSADDRISIFMNKNTNTADLYAIQVVFRLEN